MKSWEKRFWIIMTIFGLIGATVISDRILTDSNDTWTGTIVQSGNLDFKSGAYFNLSKKIYNSKGHVYNATGANLQLAIWDLNSTKGGTVWMPATTITVTGNSIYGILMTSGVTLKGAGMNATTIKLTSGAGTTTRLISCRNINNFSLCDFSIDGNDAGGQDNYQLINISAFSVDVKYFTLQNLHLINPHRAGIYIVPNGGATRYYAMYGKISNIYVDGVHDTAAPYATYQGISADCLQYSQFENIHIKSSGINASVFGVWGMDFSGMDWCTFNNVYISGTGAGMKLISSLDLTNNCSFSNFYIRNTSNNGKVAGVQAAALWLHGVRDSNFNNININYNWMGVQITSSTKEVNFNGLNVYKDGSPSAVNGAALYIQGDYIHINNAHLFNKTATKNQNGIYLSGCDYSTFSNINESGYRMGLYHISSSHNKFTNCYFNNNKVCPSGGYGVYLDTSNNVSFIGCEIKSNTGSAGINDDGTTNKNILFDGCNIMSNVKGIDFSSTTTNVSIVNSFIKYNTGDGIEIDSANFVTIMGNQIWGNGGEQIDDNIGATATNLKIMGNVGDATCNAFCLPTVVPTVAHKGSMYVNTTTGDIAVYSGTAWIWTHG